MRLRLIMGLVLLLSLGCGNGRTTTGDAGPGSGDAGPGGGDAGPGGGDAGPGPADGGMTPDDAGAGVTCNGTTCGAGEACCQTACDGTMGCTAPEGDGTCPLLGCPPGGPTVCGGDVCDPATEICVEGNFGGPTTIECRPVPPGCEMDRSCPCVAPTLCNIGLMLCSMRGNNTIFCETGLD